jgi:hypothetical protein
LPVPTVVVVLMTAEASRVTGLMGIANSGRTAAIAKGHANSRLKYAHARSDKPCDEHVSTAPI